VASLFFLFVVVVVVVVVVVGCLYFFESGVHAIIAWR
jgi:hypothetical protein